MIPGSMPGTIAALQSNEVLAAQWMCVSAMQPSSSCCGPRCSTYKTHDLMLAVRNHALK